MKILFQGDSITDAFRKPEEINPAFQLGNGYAFLVAARLGALYPQRGFEFINRGVSGQSVQQLSFRWLADTIHLQPDVLSLLIGINTLISRENGETDISDAEFFTCYRDLLEQVRAQNPDSRLVLLEPYLVEAGGVTAAWKMDLKPIQEGIAEIAEDFNAAFIPLQRIFDEALSLAPAEYWAYDGIHATHAGFHLIADAWLRTAEKNNILCMSREEKCPLLAP